MFDNYKEKRSAVRTGTRNVQRAKKGEIDKDVKKKTKKILELCETENRVPKCNISFSAG